MRVKKSAGIRRPLGCGCVRPARARIARTVRPRPSDAERKSASENGRTWSDAASVHSRYVRARVRVRKSCNSHLRAVITGATYDSYSGVPFGRAGKSYLYMPVSYTKDNHRGAARNERTMKKGRKRRIARDIGNREKLSLRIECDRFI